MAPSDGLICLPFDPSGIQGFFTDYQVVRTLLGYPSGWDPKTFIGMEDIGGDISQPLPIAPGLLRHIDESGRDDFIRLCADPPPGGPELCAHAPASNTGNVTVARYINESFDSLIGILPGSTTPLTTGENPLQDVVWEVSVGGASNRLYVRPRVGTGSCGVPPNDQFL